MTFNMNLAFKLIPFVSGDFDGKHFKKAKWPYLWTRFWFVFAVYNILRYSTLVILPSSYHEFLEFYLGKSYRGITELFKQINLI